MPVFHFHATTQHDGEVRHHTGFQATPKLTTMEDYAKLEREIAKGVAQRSASLVGTVVVQSLSRVDNPVDYVTAQLLQALQDVLDYLTEAPFHFDNGVTLHGIDEGHQKGSEYHNALIERLEELLKG